MGKGEASKIAQIGLSEATVSLQKIRAYGDPRLFALNLVAEHFAHSSQPLVPERLLVMGGGEASKDGDAPAMTNVFGQLLGLLLSEKAGLGINVDNTKSLDELAAEIRAASAKAQPAAIA